MENKLKPCPCCNGVADMVVRGGYPACFFIHCLDCGLRTLYGQNEEKAVNTWNTRKNNDPIKNFHRDHRLGWEMHNAGVRSGIRFATERFLGQLPVDLQIKMIDEVVEHLFKEYNE
jgi:hypothetical protein